MSIKERKMKPIPLANKVTFYLSILFLVLFILFISLERTQQALANLYLMFIFWGGNKVIAYIQGAEIRLTYAVKISENASKIVRALAMLLSSVIAIHGFIELWKVNF
jgi:hypothetical protein